MEAVVMVNTSRSIRLGSMLFHNIFCPVLLCPSPASAVSANAHEPSITHRAARGLGHSTKRQVE